MWVQVQHSIDSVQYVQLVVMTLSTCRPQAFDMRLYKNASRFSWYFRKLSPYMDTPHHLARGAASDSGGVDIYGTSD